MSPITTPASGRFIHNFSPRIISGKKFILSFYPLKKLIHALVLCFINLIIPLSARAQDTISLKLNEAVNIALSNNFRVKNASLRLSQQTVSDLASINLSPTEVNYKFGQLYSEENDKYLEINQHFGSILTHIRKMKQADAQQNFTSDEYELLKAELTARVKSAYFFWVFSYAASRILDEEQNMYSKLAQIADLRYHSGDISLLDKTIYLTKASEAESRFLNSLDDISIAENRLRQLLQENRNFVPESFSLDLYTIEKESDTSSYAGNRFLSYYNNQYVLARIDQAVVRSRYFPEINAGIFTQDIIGLNQLYGGQIGLAIPLWIPGNRADTKEARIETEIALNELEYQKTKIAFEIDNLLLELNKYFRQIRHFEANALPQAEILLSTAIIQLDTEEIDYPQFLESISVATDIKMEYIKTILDYNQTAIQLELYAD